MPRRLNKWDREIVRRCLSAAARGIYGEDLHPVVGLDESELEVLLNQWPAIDKDPNWELAIHNALVNACGYPLDDETVWRWFGVPREEIRRVYDRWKQSRPAGI